MTSKTKEIVEPSEVGVAARGDLNDILRLNQQFHLNIEGFEWDQPEWIKDQIDRGCYFVLRQGNHVLGAIDIQKINDSEYYIEAIAVDPDHHNSGLGKRLIMFAKERAQKMGCKTLTVESFQSYGLLDFYEKVGFVLDNPPVGYYQGKPFHRFVMKF